MSFHELSERWCKRGAGILGCLRQERVVFIDDALWSRSVEGQVILVSHR